MSKSIQCLFIWVRQRARRHAYLTTLLLATVLMAGLYNVLWIYRPDYFRLEADLNVRPIDLASGIQQFESMGSVPLPERTNPDIEAAATQLQQAYNAAQRGSARLAALRHELEMQRRLVKSGEPAFLASQDAQIERYIRQQKLPYEQQAAGLKQNMSTVLKLAGVQSPEELPEGFDAILYADLKAKLAEQGLASLRAGAEARAYALRNLARFQGTPQQRYYVANVHRIRALEKRLWNVEGATHSLVQRVTEAGENYRRAAAGRLNFADFLYFSVGGATGANFGDISPNHTFVRLFYAFQICLSIVLLALALEHVTDRRSKPE